MKAADAEAGAATAATDAPAATIVANEVEKMTIFDAAEEKEQPASSELSGSQPNAAFSNLQMLLEKVQWI